jgi:hypothetical protein
MQRLALLCLCLALTDCAGYRMWRDAPVSHGLPEITPGESQTMRRVMGRDANVEPLLPEPGNVWADVQPAPATEPLAVAPTPSVAAGHAPKTPPAIGSAAPAQQFPAVPSGRLPMVQLAAAGSQQQAEAAWRLLLHRSPRLVADRSPIFSAARVDGRDVWRLRTGGFADVATASAFCASVRAARSDCWVVSE